MIASQATQIAKQVSHIQTMTRNPAEPEGPLESKEKAGQAEANASTESMAALANGSIGRVGTGIDWGSSHVGVADRLAERLSPR